MPRRNPVYRVFLNQGKLLIVAKCSNNAGLNFDENKLNINLIIN